MSSTTDEQLLEIRDRASIEALYDRHAPRLFAVALRILGDRDAAAATLEEVFVDVASAETYGEGNPGTWLLRITRDRAIHRQAQTASPFVHEAGTRATPRRLVEDAFYRGMGVKDLAKAWGIAEDVVRGMLRDGMAELRREFATGGVK